MLRPSIAALALALSLVGLPSCGDSCESSGEGPDVVFVVIDTLRADRLPFYGYEKDTAPFLASLAERGVVFDRAWATSSWTAPSTASIFTGLYPVQHGVTQGLKLTRDVQRGKQKDLELNRIPGPIETLPELMRRLGYRTFGIADNPNICEEEGFESGFCEFETFDYRHANVVNDKLREWRDEITTGGKWFVYLHYMDPHFPFYERQPWYEKPEDAPPLPGKNFNRIPREVARPWLDAAYDSEIRYADEHIREAFEVLGVDDETVVIFVADHGEELMQRSEHIQHEFQLYGELLHVPMFVVHPGAELTRDRVRVNVSQVDLLPTLREILGARPSDQDVGRSLVPLYTEPDEPADDRTIFSMRSRLEVLGGQKKRAVIRGSTKLILTENENGEFRELYDLEADWGERTNLAKDRPQLAEQLLEAWREFERTAYRFDGESVTKTLTDEEISTIEKLGYADEGD